MNPTRAAVVFVAACLAIIGSAWLSSRRHLERSIVSGELVLPDLKAGINSVTEVRLTKAGDLKTTLHSTRDGWTVLERDYPADSSKVRKLLLDLASLAVVEEKTSNPENYAAIGVQDLSAPQAVATRIDVVSGNKTESILLGKASGAKSGFVRVPGVARSLLATPRPSVEVEAAQWLDRTLMTVPERRIKQASFSGPGGAYSVSRDKPDQNNFTVTGVPKNRKLSGETAGNASASGLDTLTFEDVRKPAAAPTTAAHASFTTFDGLTVELTGHAEGERHFVTFTAKSSTKDQEHEADTLLRRAAGREFEIPSYRYDGIFRPVEELLEKLPDAKAKPSAGAHQ